MTTYSEEKEEEFARLAELRELQKIRIAWEL